MRATILSLGLLVAAFLFPVPVAGPASAADRAADAPAAIPEDERRQIEAVVRDYLLKNPDIIVEALEALQAREQAAAEARQRDAVESNASALYRHPKTPVSGAPDAEVVLVEFFDYQCGYCKRVLPAMLDLLSDDPKLKIVWKELPILGPASEFASRAAMAAARQGKYLEFHSAVMGLRGPLSEERVIEAASSVGLDTRRLRADMDAPEIAAYLRETRQLALALGINGTPAFVLDGRIYPGALEESQIRQLIAAARANKG